MVSRDSQEVGTLLPECDSGMVKRAVSHNQAEIQEHDCDTMSSIRKKPVPEIDTARGGNS
jgi:hypothetical protein